MKPTRRKLIAVSIAITLGLVVGLTFVRGGTIRAADRIHKGMSQAEVYAILGNPDNSGVIAGTQGKLLEYWYLSDGMIIICFDNGQVFTNDPSPYLNTKERLECMWHGWWFRFWKIKGPMMRFRFVETAFA